MFKKILLFLFVFYSFVGFILLPLLIKPQIINIVEHQTKTKLSINNIYLNPYTFVLEVKNVKLQTIKNEHIFSLDSLKIDLEVLSLLNKTINISSFELVEPEISLAYYKNKTINLVNLSRNIKTTKIENKKESDFEFPRIILTSFKLKNGKLNYKDFTKTKPYAFSLNTINFSLEDIDTNDLNSSYGKIRLHSYLEDGGELDLNTKKIAFKPLRIEGSVELKESKIYSYWKYLQDELAIEIADGSLSIKANYALNLDDLNATSIEDLSVKINELRVKPKNETYDVLNLNSLYVNGVSVRPVVRDVKVKNIKLDSLFIKAKKDSDGNIDWIEFFKNNKDTIKEESPKLKTTNTNIWKLFVTDIDLHKISVDFEDSSIYPKVSTKLNELNLRMHNISLSGKKPFKYNLNLLLNDKTKCSSSGDIVHKELFINSYVKCDSFNLVHYRPYIDSIAKESLKTYDIKLLNSVLGFDTKLSLNTKLSKLELILNNTNFYINNFKLAKRSTKEQLVEFKSLKLKGIDLDTKNRSLNINDINFKSLNLNIVKYKNNLLNLDSLFEVKENKSTNKKIQKNSKDKIYRVKVKKLNLNSAKLSFSDKSLSDNFKLKLDKIDIKVSNIDSKKASTMNYDISMTLDKGRVESNGKVSHSPLKQNGTLRIKKLSLKEFSPYIAQSTYLNIDDGYLSLDSKLSYKKDKEKADLKLDGKLLIEEFFLSDSRDKSSLLSLIKAELKSFNLKLFPNYLYIDDVDLNAFYIDALIDENKKINFAKLSKNDPSLKQLDNNKSLESKEKAFPFKVMKIDIANGSANFEDKSLPIDFKTTIHDLNGVIYSVSNQKDEISYIDINGEVDEYASTKLNGSVETGDINAYMDIDFNFRNLSLNSFSGYSAKFAGYKIDKGKLYLDLGYKIYDSVLKGKNSVIIKNIELGDEIDDENISKLPLGFAIALLEDTNGVIDINMPVEGDLNEPDFKYGALVIKTFANLIVKAVASPFKFLGSVMGIDSDELSYIDFESGSSNILPSQREKLDNIAKILIKKPKLSFAITGTYNHELDVDAISGQKLAILVLKISGEKDASASMTLEILQKIYLSSLSQKELDLLELKIKKNFTKKMFNVEYQKELLKVCKIFQKVSIQELIKLADTRAKNLKTYLVNNKGIANSIISIKSNKEEKKQENALIRTLLEIEVK